MFTTLSFSFVGEVSQVCSSMGLTYCSVQQMEGKIQLVMTHLEITKGTAADDSSVDNMVMDTEHILDELSEVERKVAEKQPKQAREQQRRKVMTRQARNQVLKEKERERQGRSIIKRKSFTHGAWGQVCVGAKSSIQTLQLTNMFLQIIDKYVNLISFH